MMEEKREDYQTINVDGIEYIKVERYSFSGFTPRFQSFHIHHYLYDKFETDVFCFPKHLIRTALEVIRENIEFYKNNLNDLIYGVWVFIAGHRDDLFLNHLKNLENVPVYFGYLPKDTPAFSLSSRRKGILFDTWYLTGGCYIPARYLKNLILEEELRKE